MLKSLSTQFAATLFLGPLGLAYSSMATAVFFTLLLAVLVFSELGIYSVLLIWPFSMVTGLLMVKFYNDGVRQSGTRLLLGPDEEPINRLTEIGSWGRGFAVLSLIAVAGYIVYLYLPENRGDKPDPVVDSGTKVPVASVTDSPAAQNSNSSATQADQNTTGTSVSENSDNTEDSFAVVALPKREVTPVVIDANSGNVVSEARSGVVTNQATLLVREAVVNLRQGPGTTFAIITQVERGERLIEFARDGQWVNVEAATSGATGWIYGRLVGPVSR